MPPWLTTEWLAWTKAHKLETEDVGRVVVAVVVAVAVVAVAAVVVVVAAVEPVESVAADIPK